MAVGTKNRQFGFHTKGQISTGLMSIAHVSWPKQVSFYCWCPFSSIFFVVAASRQWRPDSRSLLWTVDVEMFLLLELCEALIWAAILEAGNSNELILCSPHESQFHHSAWWFLRLHLKKRSKFFTFSGLSDLHVLKQWWTVISLCLFELFLP